MTSVYQKEMAHFSIEEIPAIPKKWSIIINIPSLHIINFETPVKDKPVIIDFTVDTRMDKHNKALKHMGNTIKQEWGKWKKN